MSGWIIYVVVGAIGVALGFALGFWAQRQIAKARREDAESIAHQILEEAQKEAEMRKKTAALEAKQEWYRAKAEFDKEVWATRQELEKARRAANERENALKRQADSLSARERQLETQARELDRQAERLEQRRAEIDKLIEAQQAKLEEISGLTAEAAKAELLKSLEDEAKAEAAIRARRIMQEAERDAERDARRIIATAIQRLAAEQSVESTVTVVSLPSDEMKGRIIGREGRNIRAFETATGVDVIIDDTPEAVLLSGYDPVRREVARLALEKLISDGRIHPGRIEEVVEKVSREVEREIKETGERVALDLGIHGLHPELIRHLGALRYRTSFGQNVLKHSIEVANLSAMIASELGLDASIAKRAGLLHDIGKAVDHEVEGPHAIIGMELAKRCNEKEVVYTAVGAHHNEIETDSVYAYIVQAGDAISGARPGARRETLEAYIKRLEKLEQLAESFSGVEKCFAIQAGRELRVMVQHDRVTDEEAIGLASDVAKKIEQELQYPGQIKVVVIRETRAIDYAR